MKGTVERGFVGVVSSHTNMTDGKLQRRSKARDLIYFCVVTALSFYDSVLANPGAKVSPKAVSVISRDRTAFAVSDPSSNETVVYVWPKTVSSRAEILWRFPKSFMRFAISNDGMNLVAEETTVPGDVHDDYVLLTFIRHGDIVRRITLRQLIGSTSNLQPMPQIVNGAGPEAKADVEMWRKWRNWHSPAPTVTPPIRISPRQREFLSWGKGLYGIDQNNFALVDAISGFFIFDCRTGKCLFPKDNPIDPQ